jgi:MFS family permease
VVLPLVAGVVLLAVFVWRELRVAHPLLDLRLYLNKAFRASAMSTFLGGGMVFIGSLILLPLYFQIVLHDDPLQTGLLLAPRGAGTALAMWLSGRLSERLGPGHTAVCGSVIGILGSIPFVMIDAGTSYTALAVAMVVQGFGVGLAGMPAMTAAYRTLRPRQINDATPQSNMIMRVGGSFGVAIFTVVLQHHLSGAGPSTAAQAAAFAATYWWVLGITVLSLVPTVFLLTLERRHLLVPPPPEVSAAGAEIG